MQDVNSFASIQDCSSRPWLDCALSAQTNFVAAVTAALDARARVHNAVAVGGAARATLCLAAGVPEETISFGFVGGALSKFFVTMSGRTETTCAALRTPSEVATWVLAAARQFAS